MDQLLKRGQIAVRQMTEIKAVSNVRKLKKYVYSTHGGGNTCPNLKLIFYHDDDYQSWREVFHH